MVLNVGIGSIAMRLLTPALGALAVFASPLSAQELERFDPGAAPVSAPTSPLPNTGIDADLVDPRTVAPVAPSTDDLPPLPTVQPLPPSTPTSTPMPVPAQPDAFGEPTAAADLNGDLPYAGVEGEGTAGSSAFDTEFAEYDVSAVEDGGSLQWADPASGVTAGDLTSDEAAQLAEADAKTYAEDDLIGAAEGVFGKGAEGLAKMIEGLLKKEGKPNGYIVGREAGGAFIIGARYGSGTLHHKVEGERKVYWTGPSIGFDAGANAAKTFVLVYNLFDTEDLFKRYPSGEGQAYLIGGLHASYMRRGDVVLIPIRLGAGVRLGVNAGYMKFSKKQRWLPF